MPNEPAENQIRALVRVIRDRDARARLDEDVEGYLRGHGVEGADLAQMSSLGATRLEAYRALVHNRVRNTVDDFIPRVADRIGSRRLRRDVAGFLADRAIHSPYLRDVPAEFVAWAIPTWERDPDIPGYIPDLARHELLRLDVKNTPRGSDLPTGEKIDLERAVRVEGSAVVVRYAYAVHKLSKERTDRTEPELQETCLIAFRGGDDQTHYIDCREWVARLIERLIAGETLRAALFATLESLAMPLDDDILARAAVVLADFMDQGLLLGAEPG